MKNMGCKGKNDRGKDKNRVCAKLVWVNDGRLQNRKWAKTDVMTSAFAHYQGVVKRKWIGKLT